MPPTRYRPKTPRKSIEVAGPTYDGRDLLPNEVPILHLEERSNDEERYAAAVALFDDLFAVPGAPRVATPLSQADQREIEEEMVSGQEPEAWAEATSGQEPEAWAEASAHEVAEAWEEAPWSAMADAWGESGEIIEEWFRTGEYELSPEPEPPRPGWLASVISSIRRAWSRDEETAWSPAGEVG